MSSTDHLAPPDLRLVGTCERLSSSAVRSLRFLLTQTFPNGALCYVRSVKAWFQLDRSSTATDDAITVINAQGGGRWHRKAADFLTASPWLVQTSWYIDAANGDDELGGDTFATAIASHAEFERRMGPNPLITQEVTVNIFSDLDEILQLEASFAGANGVIRYVGHATVLATDIANAWVAFGVNSEGQLTGTTIGDFTPYIGKRIRIRTGGFNGFYTWISAIASTAMVNEIARVGALTGITGTPVNANNITVTDNAAPGQTYEIEDLPTVKGVNFRSHRLDSGGDGWAEPLTFVLDGVFVDAGAEETASVMDCDAASASPKPMLLRCGVRGRLMGREVRMRGCISATSAGALTTLTVDGAYVEMRGHVGGELVFRNCTFGASGILQSYFDYNNGVSFIAGTKTYVPGGSGGLDFGIYVNNGTQGIWVDGSSQISFDDIWGTQIGTGDGFRIDGRAWYDATASITTFTVGAGNDTVIGGVGVAYGALPNANAATLSMFVVEL